MLSRGPARGLRVQVGLLVSTIRGRFETTIGDQLRGITGQSHGGGGGNCGKTEEMEHYVGWSHGNSVTDSILLNLSPDPVKTSPGASRVETRIDGKPSTGLTINRFSDAREAEFNERRQILCERQFSGRHDTGVHP
jgi:hypothetical protein